MLRFATYEAFVIGIVEEVNKMAVRCMASSEQDRNNLAIHLYREFVSGIVVHFLTTCILIVGRSAST